LGFFSKKQKYKPFNYEDLKKVTLEEVRLMKGLLNLLPRLGFDASLQGAVVDMLKPYLGDDFSLTLRGMATAHESPFSKGHGFEEIYAVIGMSPLPHKALIKIDPVLAFVMIDRILGGEGEVAVNRFALTEAEQGVLSYLILKFLAQIYERSTPEKQVHFRFEGFRFSSQELQGLIAEGTALVFLHFEAVVGKKTGMIQVILPDPFLTQALLQPFARVASSPQEKEAQKRRQVRIAHIQAPVWAEIGQASLSPREISGLERGDVVLLDQSLATLKEGHVGGRATLRVGKGEIVAIPSAILDDGPKMKLKLGLT